MSDEDGIKYLEGILIQKSETIPKVILRFSSSKCSGFGAHSLVIPKEDFRKVE